jgi:hypothetical protein
MGSPFFHDEESLGRESVPFFKRDMGFPVVAFVSVCILAGISFASFLL